MTLWQWSVAVIGIPVITGITLGLFAQYACAVARYFAERTER